MSMGNACCFIGHRKVDLTEAELQYLRNLIENLICNGIVTYLFGSRSQFNDICHKIVTELKQTYPNIKRVQYSCKSESCLLEKDKEEWKRLYSYIDKDEQLLCMDEEVEFDTKFTSGKASYVERNQAMINDSNYCIFYYKEDYLPNPRRNPQKLLGLYQPKSGTRIAYVYAKSRKKKIINVAL